MTLPVSGPMQTSMINVELALPATQLITLNDTRVRTLAAKPAGIIALNDFYGKSDRLVNTVTLAANSANYTFNPAKVTGYIAGKTDAILIINTGIYVYATTTAGAGLTVSGWATGDTVTVINNGYIIGRGGNGAGGGSYNGSPGGAGGIAISLSKSISITNNSYIAGGGGGGGEGPDNGGSYATGGGGGGGAGGGNGGTILGGVGGTGGGPGLVGANSPNTRSGAGGGRVLPGVGGIGKPLGQFATGGGSGGAGGAGEDDLDGTTSEIGGNGGSNSSPGQSRSIAGGGGGGWGASGGLTGGLGVGGAGGKAIALNGFTATRSGTGVTYGAVS